MGKINMARVIVGGLAAGVVLNIGEIIANRWLFAEAGAAAMAELGLEEPGGGAIAGFIVMMFVAGITTTWLYAAIRPRMGPGPGTALCAGLFVWFLLYLWTGVGYVLVGMYPAGLMAGFVIFGAVEFAVAGLVGGWFYREEGDAPQAAVA